MDPTMADSEYLLVVNQSSIDRLTLSLPMRKMTTAKPRISSSGSSVFLEIPFSTTTIPPYINGKKTNEPYLKDYIARFKKINCNRPYTGKGFEENGELFRQLANTAQAFTVDKDGNPKFTLKLPRRWIPPYLEMTGSFQKIAVRSELSRKNKSKAKPSLDYGRSTLSKLY